MTYLDKTDTIWRCDNCLSYYDTKIQDKPLKNKSGFKLHSFLCVPTECQEGQELDEETGLCVPEEPHPEQQEEVAEIPEEQQTDDIIYSRIHLIYDIIRYIISLIFRNN